MLIINSLSEHYVKCIQLHVFRDHSLQSRLCSHFLDVGSVEHTDVLGLEVVVVRQLQHVEDCVFALSVKVSVVQVERLDKVEAVSEQLSKLRG